MAKKIKIASKSFDSESIHLNLDGVVLDSLEQLAPFEKLRDLEINGASIDSLAAMPKLPSLQRLYIRDNPLTQLRGLEALSNLQELSVHNCPIENYEPISSLSSLSVLTIGRELQDFARVGGSQSLSCLRYEQCTPNCNPTPWVMISGTPKASKTDSRIEKNVVDRDL